VTGGYVYRGAAWPEFNGRYYFADFSEGRIWSIARSGDGWTNKRLERDTPEQISSFGEDEAGELYVVAIGGKIFQIVDISAPAAALSTSSFVATPAGAVAGDVISYALVLRNTGGATAGAVQASMQVPAVLAYIPNSLQATAGSTNATGAPALTWLGV